MKKVETNLTLDEEGVEKVIFYLLKPNNVTVFGFYKKKDINSRQLMIFAYQRRFLNILG